MRIHEIDQPGRSSVTGSVYEAVKLALFLSPRGGDAVGNGWMAQPHLAIGGCDFLLLALLTLCCFTRSSRAAWLDPAWGYRREIDANWDPAGAAQGELAVAEAYTAGHARPDGGDVRVATEAGALVASHVLMAGPGDRVRIVYTLARPVKKYFVYFGNQHPTPPPAGLEDVSYESGLHLEMKGATHGFESFKEAEAGWNQAGGAIGQTLIPSPFLGINPFGEKGSTLSRLSGALFCPQDGQYGFAMWVRERGALLIDGSPVLLGRPGPADISNRVKIQLTRGKHAWVFYHFSLNGDGALSVAWSRPGSPIYSVIGREAFGTFHTSGIGPLQERGGKLVSDFSTRYMGESFFADSFSQHYRFTAHPAGAAGSCQWDFGDGQTATQDEVDHVYLVDGVYPIKLTVRVGGIADTQVTRFVASRDWEHITNPPQEDVQSHSHIVAGYDDGKLPEPALERALLLHQRAGEVHPMLAAARALAILPKHDNPGATIDALVAAAATVPAGEAPFTSIWRSVPPGSDLQPRAAAQLAEQLLWHDGAFAEAVRALAPVAAGGDARTKRTYAQALVLDQKADEGRKILEALPAADASVHRVALAGAMARTIEYYLTEKDSAAAQAAWERWQAQFPADFLEGYSVLLRVRLLELEGNPATAAKVAEGFAAAVPDSPYAPQLLDRASKLLAQVDPQKSSGLRQMLRRQYPEDPLSQ